MTTRAQEPTRTSTRRRAPQVEDVEVRDLWPRLTRFYGLTYEDLARMPRVVRARYAEALPELLAEEQLRALEAAAFPHMKKGDAQRVQRHYAKQLPHSTERASATVVRPEDLTALGIEVEFSGAAPAVLETTFDPWAEQLEDDDDDGYEEDDE